MLGSGACSKGPAAFIASAPDSTRVHISCPFPAEHIDLFLYSDAGTRPLLHYRRVRENMPRIPCPEEDGILVAIANLPGEPRTDALRVFDNIEHISMPYAREDPAKPIMSGVCVPDAGAAITELQLKPMLCCVHIVGIDARLDFLLEAPALFLSDVAAEAEILQNDGFHPPRTLQSPDGLEHPEMMLQAVPSELGRNSVQVDIRLWCYPNEDELRPTTLCLSGLHAGGPLEFPCSLGPLRRGDTRKLKLETRMDGLFLETVP